MNAPFILAQNTITPGSGAGRPQTTVKIEKPQGGQALSIHLDGSTKVDLSGVTGEKITLVHVGDRLVILFDNQATVTLEPFFGGDGQPLPDVTVQVGPDRDVSSADFAGLFPITTDQSILPAAGAAGSPMSGANFQG